MPKLPTCYHLTVKVCVASCLPLKEGQAVSALKLLSNKILPLVMHVVCLTTPFLLFLLLHFVLLFLPLLLLFFLLRVSKC